MKHIAHNGIARAAIPDYVTRVTDTLAKAGFESYLVGGCVRDMIMGRIPKDWDVTTNAKPEEIQALFEKTVYENTFGTVGVCLPRKNEATQGVSRENREGGTHLPDDKAGETPEYDIVEVTPYRIEAVYSDFRHPDEVVFSKDINDDLKRRDFTVNAMAYDPIKDILIDPFKGQDDIKNMSLKTVGAPVERFSEDALRMMRAVRFACQLATPESGQGFTIAHETMKAIAQNAQLIKNISTERIRDEFEKIIMSPEPMVGVAMLEKFGLLKFIIPELEEGIGCEQGGAHRYDVYEHLLHALGHAADKKWNLDIRLAALFHDIGKPRSRRTRTGAELSDLSGPRISLLHGPDHAKSHNSSPAKKPYTFYGHEVIGARMAKAIMERMKFPKDVTEMVVKLVRYHMFFSDTEAITLSAVRRTIVNIGRENIWTLMNIRECDRVGMAKAEAPYRLRKYHAMIEEALRAPTSVGMLKIDGRILKDEIGIAPGPRMGWMLHALLEECLEDDAKNTIEYLKSRVFELDTLSDKELRELGEKGKQAKEEVEQEEIEGLRKKHGVK